MHIKILTPLLSVVFVRVAVRVIAWMDGSNMVSSIQAEN